jgi:RNA polymerase sigma factor (sigma-70 family)
MGHFKILFQMIRFFAIMDCRAGKKVCIFRKTSVFLLKGDPVNGEKPKTIEAEIRAGIEDYLSSGDTRCWSLMFETFKLHIFNSCRAMLGNNEDAGDLTSETFMKAMEKIRSYDRNRPFFPWLLRISKNLCIDHIRRIKRNRMAYPEDWEKFSLEPVSAPDEKDPVRIGRIREAILRLKRPQKVCFCLFYMHDKSYKDIAELTGYTTDEVRSYIQNGRRNFKLRMG